MQIKSKTDDHQYFSFLSLLCVNSGEEAFQPERITNPYIQRMFQVIDIVSR